MGFEKGHRSWNTGLDIKGNKKYSEYRKKLHDAGVARYSREFPDGGSIAQQDMKRVWASDKPSEGLFASIRRIFGIKQ